jgi:excisionase family DNA binding protein
MRADKVGRAQERSVDEAVKKAGTSGSSIHLIKRRSAEANGEDDLIRLIRIIARQAVREAFSVFREAVDEDAVKPLPALDPRNPEQAQEGPAGKEWAPPEPGERFLSVAEAATRLGVSEKTVRRKIASGDWPAHRVGKLLRVSERVLTASLTPARPPKG